MSRRKNLYPTDERTRMNEVTERKKLKEEIRERRKTALPALRAAIVESKRQRKARLANCRRECRDAKKLVKMRAKIARKKLADAIKRAKERAKATCKSCSTVERSGTESVKERLDALDRELREIKKLQAAASELKSKRGQAGGKASAEARGESDSQVINDLGENREIVELFKKNRAKFKKTRNRSRTEAFLEWVGDHPEALDELRADEETKFAAEAERLLSERKPPTEYDSCPWDLEKCRREVAELRAAERFLSEAEKSAPF